MELCQFEHIYSESIETHKTSWASQRVQVFLFSLMLYVRRRSAPAAISTKAFMFGLIVVNWSALAWTTADTIFSVRTDTEAHVCSPVTVIDLSSLLGENELKSLNIALLDLQTSH